MLIYSITNIVNGKMYIGQTTKSLEDRIKNHKNACRSGKHFKLYDAVREYGWDKFIFKVIAYADSKDVLDDLEVYYIKKFDTIQNGYNMAPGGNINIMCSEEIAQKHDEKMRSFEVREKISRSMKLSYALRGGQSEEHRRHLSENKKAFYASEKGEAAKEKFRESFKLTPEHQAKILDALKIKVSCFDESGNLVASFDSVKEAALWVNESLGTTYNIKSLCGRIKKSNDTGVLAYGYCWKYRV